MNADAAMSFVRQHGMVLVSAKGPAPRLTEAIAGEPIKGSWWAHPKSHQIFAILQQLDDSPDILVCRFLGGALPTFIGGFGPPSSNWRVIFRLISSPKFARSTLPRVST